MFDKYKDTDINHYKMCLQEIGNEALRIGDKQMYRMISDEWHNVEAYQKSLTPPWEQKSKVLH